MRTTIHLQMYRGLWAKIADACQNTTVKADIKAGLEAQPTARILSFTVSPAERSVVRDTATRIGLKVPGLTDDEEPQGIENP